MTGLRREKKIGLGTKSTITTKDHGYFDHAQKGCPIFTYTVVKVDSATPKKVA